MESNVNNYLHPNPYLGFEFEEKCKTLKILPESEKVIRGVAIQFIIDLVTELQKRLPDNIDTLKKISLLSPNKCLNTIKEPLLPLAKLMHFNIEDISKIEVQWQKLHLIQWKKTISTVELWAEINDYTDSSGLNPFNELCKLAKCLLVLPWSNAEVERCFSQINLIKNSHKNKLSNKTTNAILTIRAGLRRMEKCCNTFIFPDNVLLEIGKLLKL